MSIWLETMLLCIVQHIAAGAPSLQEIIFHNLCYDASIFIIAENFIELTGSGNC